MSLEALNDLADVLSAADLHELVESQEAEYEVSTNNLNVNFSKQLLTNEAWNTLLNFAKEKQLKQKIHALLSGEIVNPTEGRAALHTALREPKDSGFSQTDKRVAVHAELKKLEEWVEKLQQGSCLGSTGKVITDVVYFGVGGSNLGPEFVIDSLAEFETQSLSVPKVHFVSCMDGIQLLRVLKQLNAEQTLMVICSKSFGTKDTLLNAQTMLQWFTKELNSDTAALESHTLGISSNPERMSGFGIPKDKQLLLWGWVGGRFSFWSTVGFPIALRLGMQNFRELLAGGHAMDQHFANTELENNIPVVLGLLSYWNSSFLKLKRNMVLPYDARLKLLAEYLAQLHMESLGKQVTLQEEFVEQSTGSMLWGGIGTNSQHSFYQLLHQGTEPFYADFVLVEKEPDYSNYSNEVKKCFSQQYQYAHANCYAQSDLMAFGQEDANPNRCYPGNHPSVMIKLKELTPFTLGQLVALYEHRTYVNAVMLDINAFDQFGVEQGKLMAEEYFHKM